MLALQPWPVVATLLAFVAAQTPPGFTPSCSMALGVTYSEGIYIHPGSLFQASDAFAIRPEISSPHLDIHKRYAMFMIDLDVIADGEATTNLHWYQPDLLKTSNSGELFNLSDNGALYVGPDPPPGPGHRYVFLLFVQPSGYVIPECFSDILSLIKSDRQGFNIELFMQVAELGKPIAANYFFAVNSDVATSTQVATVTSLSSADCHMALPTSENLHLELH